MLFLCFFPVFFFSSKKKTSESHSFLPSPLVLSWYSFLFYAPSSSPSLLNRSDHYINRSLNIFSGLSFLINTPALSLHFFKGKHQAVSSSFIPTHSSIHFNLALLSRFLTIFWGCQWANPVASCCSFHVTEQYKSGLTLSFFSDTLTFISVHYTLLISSSFVLLTSSPNN